MKKIITLLSIVAIAITSCSEDKPETTGVETTEVNASTDEEVSTEEVVNEEAVADVDAEMVTNEEEVVEEVDEEGASEKAVSTEESTSDDGTLTGDINAFINGDETGEKVFELTEVSFDEKDLSEQGNLQLDEVAAILKANPNLVANIQAHLPAKMGAKPKTSAWALWVKTKLVVVRGVKSKQLSAKGYGSEQLIKGLDSKDDAHKRLLISLKK